MTHNSLNQALEVINLWGERVSSNFARDVRRGLTSDQKFLPSKYFYDSRGSQLFDQICTLPEYYLTRTEISLLKDKAGSMMKDFQAGDLVELGSGGNRKIRTLLDALDRDARSLTRYVPVDVSETAIKEAARELVSMYPELRVLGVVADFMQDLHLVPNGRSKLMLFLGSTIGNLRHDESVDFLRTVSQCLGRDDRFLLGLDLVKPTDILEAAYNDAQGVTAEFNRNMLRVVNRELDANFSPDHFDHVAFFNEAKEQVEMHLRANRRVRVDIAQIELTVTVEEGETIHTEISRKFRRASAERMIEASGLKLDDWYTDPKGWFAIADLVRAH